MYILKCWCCDLDFDFRVVYVIEWNSPYTNVSCTECSVNSEHMFLPGWFLTKQSPSTKEGLDS